MISLLYVIISFTGIIHNILVCIVVIQNRSMHTATNYFLCSLALSGILILLTRIPHELSNICNGGRPYAFGLTFCMIRAFTAEVSTNASILTITTFTIKRYINICHPLRSHVMSHLGSVTKLITLFWVLAFVFAIPQFFQYGLNEKEECSIIYQVPYAFELSAFLFFVVPMTIITVIIKKTSRREDAAITEDTTSNGIQLRSEYLLFIFLYMKALLFRIEDIWMIHLPYLRLLKKLIYF
ncbi:UNVERIFIED_CONTAM: hypothetical protein GTU68_015806 [Idotea baltica]|nr:hypothetical protein [Idotea baltica]